MSKSKKMAVPVLEDVVVLGKEMPPSELPGGLDELQMQALQQQIERIVHAQLDAVLNKTSQHVVKEIKTYLDKELPKLIKAASRS
jgi:hypothetical protein